MGWMFNQAELAEDRPVYAIDLPGHGGSSKDVGDGSTRDLAKAVTDFMDAKGISSAHLVGHSLGGAVATLIASKSPERVAALTLIAPGGLGPEIAQDFIEGFIAETRARKLKPVIEMLTADPKLVTDDMVEDVLKFKRLDGATAALRKIADANFVGGEQRGSLRDRLGGSQNAGAGDLGRRRPRASGEARRRPAAEREGDADRRRRPHPAPGESGGRERRDQGIGLEAAGAPPAASQPLPMPAAKTRVVNSLSGVAAFIEKPLLFLRHAAAEDRVSMRKAAKTLDDPVMSFGM